MFTLDTVVMSNLQLIAHWNLNLSFTISGTTAVSKTTRIPFSRRPTARLFENLYEKCAPDFTHPAKIWCVGVVDMHYFDLDLGTQTRPRYGSDLLAC